MSKTHFNLGKGRTACGAKSMSQDPLRVSADPLKVTCENCKRAPNVNAMLLRDKVQTYEALLHEIHFAAAVAMNGQRVKDLIDLISNWSFAHRAGNGEYSDQAQAAMVAAAYERLRL